MTVPKLEAEVAQWDAAMMATATGIITEDRPRAADPQATVAVTVVVGWWQGQLWQSNRR